jgi:signal transduction histidine kinase/PAS domain-containing protein
VHSDGDLTRLVSRARDLQRRLSAARPTDRLPGAHTPALAAEAADLLAELERWFDVDSGETSVPAPVVPAGFADRAAAAPSPGAVVERESGLAEFLPDPYLVTDAHGMIRQANPAAAALFNRPQWYLVGKPLPVLVDVEQRAEFRRAMTGLLRHQDRIDDWVVAFRPTGEECAPFEATITAGAVHDAAGDLVALRWLLRRTGSGAAGGSGGPAPPPLVAPYTLLAGDPSTHRAELLTKAGALLASSFNVERMLAGVARLALPLLGDFCVVDVLHDERPGVRRLHVAHVHPHTAELARELAGHAPAALPAGSRLVVARREGEPGVPGLSGDALAEIAPDPEQREALERLGPVSCIVVLLVGRGNTLGALTFVMAESGRRHGAGDFALAQELAQRLALALDNARLYRVAQRANEAKSDFLAAMSHELRTPLTAIMGYTEILAEGIGGPVTAAQRQHLGRILASSAHLLSIVEEILTFSRLEAGREEMAAEDADLLDIVRSAVSLVEPLVVAKGLDLHVRVPQSPVPLRTDPIKVRQILVNLLGNAVKFTSRGEVGVRLWAEGDRVLLEVWDTGIGVPAEHLDNIFHPFWQVEQKSTRRFGGTGLGLSLVRRLSQMLGGDVRVESAVGSGSRFTVWLPAEGVPGKAHQEGVKANETGAV